MKNRRNEHRGGRFHRLWGILLLLGCVPAQEARQEPPVPVILAEVPATLAILPFENNSVSEPERYEPLTNGLMAMLITDLSQAGTALKVIERHNIKNLLKEIALGQSGVIDEATAVRAGRILGAQSIAFGSFVVLGDQVRIDTRLVKTETSELITAESIVGASDAFMQLERDLAQKIGRTLKWGRPAAETEAEGDLEAAVLFSRGVEAWDEGRAEEAEEWFAKSVERDPAFAERVAAVKGGQPWSAG
jgi:TolB-like protein